MGHEHVELAEGSLVEQELQPLTRRQPATSVLGFGPAAVAAGLRLFAQVRQLLELGGSAMRSLPK
jgi:hypothetical protein